MVQNYTGLGVGRHRIMDLPRSFYAVYFSAQEALLHEADKLEIDLQNEDVRAIEYSKNMNFYSIRSYDGTPHVLLKVTDDAVQWCRGSNMGRPTNYMRQIVTFIVKKRLEVAADMACTGIISQKGKYYNIYDLPKGFVYHGDMDLSYADLIQLPDMRTVVIKGDYDISGNYLYSFSGAPAKVEGDFIFMDNGIPNIFKHRPQFTVIGGKYYNDFYPNGR